MRAFIKLVQLAKQHSVGPSHFESLLPPPLRLNLEGCTACCTHAPSSLLGARHSSSTHRPSITSGSVLHEEGMFSRIMESHPELEEEVAEAHR